MPDGSNFVLQLPRPGEPESAMLPGMGVAAPRELVESLPLFIDPNIPDTSIGPVALQQVSRWQYDFDPATGNSRASYTGAVLVKGTDGAVIEGDGITSEASLFLTATGSNWPVLIFSGMPGASKGYLEGNTNGVKRWALNLGNPDPETGSNSGSDFTIDRFDDAGNVLPQPVKINRETSAITLFGDVSMTSDDPTGGESPGTLSITSAFSNQLRLTGINGNWATVIFDTETPGPGGVVSGFLLAQKHGVGRWSYMLADTDQETGGGTNSGSNFRIFRMDDNGNNLGEDPFILMVRATGQVNIRGVVQGNALVAGDQSVAANNCMVITPGSALANPILLTRNGGGGFQFGANATQNSLTITPGSSPNAGITLNQSSASALLTTNAPWLFTAAQGIRLTSASGANLTSGTGAPTGNQPVGSLYMRTDGAVGSTLYVSRASSTWLPVAGV